MLVSQSPSLQSTCVCFFLPLCAFTLIICSCMTACFELVLNMFEDVPQRASIFHISGMDWHGFRQSMGTLSRCLVPQAGCHQSPAWNRHSPDPKCISPEDSEEAEADVDLTRRRPLWRENTLAPDTSESHRSRQLQRMWLRTSTGTWLCHWASTKKSGTNPRTHCVGMCWREVQEGAYCRSLKLKRVMCISFDVNCSNLFK